MNSTQPGDGRPKRDELHTICQGKLSFTSGLTHLTRSRFTVLAA